MPGWVWVVLGLVMLFVIGSVIYLYIGVIEGRRLQDDLIEHGERVEGWIVHVEPAKGWMYPMVLVAITPDEEVDPDEMRILVRHLGKLRKRGSDDAKVKRIVKFMKASHRVDGIARPRLPRLLSDSEVYLQWIGVTTENLEKLGGEDVLEEECLAIILYWHRPLMEAAMPYIPKKKRSRRDD